MECIYSCENTGHLNSQNETLANIKNYLQSQFIISTKVSYEKYGSVTIPAGGAIALAIDDITTDGYEWIGIRNQYWGGANFIYGHIDIGNRLMIFNVSNNNTITIDRWYIYLIYAKKFV